MKTQMDHYISIDPRLFAANLQKGKRLSIEVALKHQEQMIQSATLDSLAIIHIYHRNCWRRLKYS